MTTLAADAPPPSEAESPARGRRAWAWAVGGSLACALVAAGAIRAMGRVWWCPCDRLFLWASDPSGPHQSRHLVDGYTFSHVQHGLFFWFFLRLVPGLRYAHPAWRFAVGVAIECAWEIAENTPLVINRYRSTGAAAGYEGDAVLNSLADIAAAAAGYGVAALMGAWGTVGLFVLIEAVMLWLIRDSLLLNVLNLFGPIDAIERWQARGRG